MTKRKTLLLSSLLASSIFFGGCSAFVAQPADTTSESPDVTLTGSLIQAGTIFSLNVVGKAPVELDSRQVSLKDYVDKTVTVTGQYSGTTLFVSQIK
ncbi:hypothetical protein HYU91_00200 [Candidatus Collierbacteria bacterium]|nr:hypothetical protein [Candidatus Collierbacteria bacterium]